MRGRNRDLSVLSLSGVGADGKSVLLWLVRNVPDGQWHEAIVDGIAGNSSLKFQISGDGFEVGLKDMSLTTDCHICKLILD